MGVGDDLGQFVEGEVLGLGPGGELLQPQIDGVGAEVERRERRIRSAGRGEQFHRVRGCDGREWGGHGWDGRRVFAIFALRRFRLRGAGGTGEERRGREPLPVGLRRRRGGEKWQGECQSRHGRLPFREIQWIIWVLYASAPVVPAEFESGMPRTSHIQRTTGETQIDLSIDLDGTGRSSITTGVGFFDHMLTLLSRHSLIDLTVQATGDLHVDAHHTVEDVGICLGKALDAGPRRQGRHPPLRRRHGADGRDPGHGRHRSERAGRSASGEPKCRWRRSGLSAPPWPRSSGGPCRRAGAFDLHVVLHHGRNTHHIVEGIFKATARALREAVEPDPRSTGVPSTKGVL